MGLVFTQLRLRRIKMKPRDLKLGDLCQIHPKSHPEFGGCLLCVKECKEWGAHGYIFFNMIIGDPVTNKGLAYYKCKFENMEYVGRVKWFNEGLQVKYD